MLFPLFLSAQLDTDRTAGGGLVNQPQKEKASKNLVTTEELTALDQKFRQELDAAQEAEDREKFAHAEQQFGQLSVEVDALLKRIAVATFPKNSKMKVNGVETPVTIQAESDWFGRTREKAEQGKAESGDKLAPAQVREIIQAVVKEMNDKGYLDPAKYPDMPDDARSLFRTLSEAANKYLSQ
ncbi:MAG TPA: hypothetical protein VHC90_21480 [Bryobacteraceae bacterium]|nr:hypothetical protein [Bryobacteraceae bacterium]